MAVTCIICGKDLPKGRKKYCSKACNREADRRKAIGRYEHSGVYRELICPDCGKTVWAHIKSKRCPDCQAAVDRVNAANCRERAKYGKTRHKGERYPCENCGQLYVLESGMQKYCRNCRDAMYKINDRRSSREWNRKAYADLAKRAEVAERRAVSIPRQIVCQICGKEFTAKSVNVKYCSAACLAESVKRKNAAYHQVNAESIKQRHRATLAARLAAMTPEERKAYRDRLNAQARKNYARRKAEKQEAKPE